ncbi:contractile injection system tape measure protein [Spirosoma validum]|uniref:Uncharacterized protein n=1 Tax=Spirosoma validum TaxID=2771355 RepID=A0A927GD48_9BACT|nr:contractile injection system tape measure protein [Spirosoma validum]MBD2753190.1 hypothetical protein [Spirosoma validum]
MSQNHLIGNVALNVHASRQTDGVALQTEVSEWFWQDLLPELNQALDAVIEPHTVVRLDRIAIELPAVGKKNWKEKLTQSVCRMIAEEIIRRRLFPRSTDAPVQEVSPTANRFEAWLDFIRTGHRRLSVATPVEWELAALDLIATSPVAVSTFRQLLRTQPVALERLVRQYDDPFLVQLAEAMTGRSARELLRWQTAFRGLFAVTWWQKCIGITLVEVKNATSVFWLLVFEKLSTDTYQSELSQWVNSTEFFKRLLERVTRRSFSATSQALVLDRFFQQQHRQQAKPKTRAQKSRVGKSIDIVFETTQLQQAIREAFRNVSEGELLVSLFEKIVEEHRTVITNFLAKQSQISSSGATVSQSADAETELPVEKSTEAGRADNVSERMPIDNPIHTDVDEGEVFYVPNAGVVLLHPFLSAYFTEVGLQPNRQSDHRRAVQLIHYLATGKTKTPEYEQGLPKILAGWPINQPIDGSIRLTKREKAEAKSLLDMVIAYWSALGSTSVAGLREGFFYRDGRLTKRDNGWLLQVERQTIDILLDQLPWGIGVIKHSWMNEFLYVEWY